MTQGHGYSQECNHARSTDTLIMLQMREPGRHVRDLGGCISPVPANMSLPGTESTYIGSETSGRSVDDAD